MSLPEVIPSNLPVFTRKTPRSNFANSVVPDGFALIFAQSDSNSGLRLVYKNSQGNFIEIGGGGGDSVDVTLGVVDSNGKFQPLKFNGTDASESGSPQTVQNYKTWNSTYPVPTPAPVSSMNFYKCSSVDTSNSTWSGKLATISDSTGIWYFSSDSVSGLTYDGYHVPIVGRVYAGQDCIFQVIDYKSEQSFEFAPDSYNTGPDTGIASI